MGYCYEVICKKYLLANGLGVGVSLAQKFNAVKFSLGGDKMAKTYEAMMEAMLEKTFAKIVAPLLKEMAQMKKEIESLSKVIESNAESTNIAGERCITKAEARSRLGVNKAKFARLVEEGKLLTVKPPAGREKIIESSVNNYIKILQGAVV